MFRGLLDQYRELNRYIEFSGTTRSTSNFYSLQSETPTLLISTYKYGSATVGVEFQSLRDRAQSSGGPNILDVACLDVCDDADVDADANADDLSGD